MGIFYGVKWYEVKEGSFREGILTDYGEMAVYEDPYDAGVVFVLDPIHGYKIRKPSPLPLPPEDPDPVIDLFPR